MSKRQILPWLEKTHHNAIWIKARLYNKGKTSKRPDLSAKNKLQKRDRQRNLRRAHWSLINDKLSASLEIQNSKSFWSYIKSQRQDRCGVSPTLHDDQLHSISKRKAEILNQQFCSVFTDEDTPNMSKLEGPPTPDKNKIEITESGITKLLSELKAIKYKDLMSFQIHSSKMLPKRYLLLWKMFSSTSFKPGIVRWMSRG